MLVSPFTFYRGAALVMAADLASTPTSGLHAQVCGDAHLSNFGVFGSPERRLMFDVNDFDETLPGPWEWDVKRLSASLEIAGRNNGFTDAERRTVVLAGSRQYRTSMTQYAAMPNLQVWYSHLDIEAELQKVQSQLDRKRTKAVEKNIAKTRARDSVQAFAKLTDEAMGEPRIVSEPPLIVPIEELIPEGMNRENITKELLQLVRRYRGTLETDRRYLLEQFRLVDLARKVVGVGSVGTRAWIGLFLGRNNQDPLFLQMKEAQESVLERFVIPGSMALYAQICASTLARAHARSGDRIAIASYMGKGDVFDVAIADFSVAYADQNERDYARLQAAVKKGTIKAQTGL
jgi:uncharacterized protein (DUF2252 family)